MNREAPTYTLSVNASAINKDNKVKKKVSFSNPSKIVKQRLDKEKNYGVSSRSLRNASQESGTIVDDEDEGGHVSDIPDDGDDEMEDAVPTPATVATKKKGPRFAKYIDKFNTPERRAEAFETLMEQTLLIKFKDLVAMEGNIVKMLGKRLPVVPAGGRSDVVVEEVDPRTGIMSVHVDRVQTVRMPEEEAPGMAMHTAKVEALIGGKFKTAAILDSGAEVNVMTKATAEKAKLMIYRNKRHVFQTISGDDFVFYGKCLEVEINVGGIINYADFFIIEAGSLDILLGMQYFFRTKLNFKYPEDGTMQAVLTSHNGLKRGTVTVAGDEIDLMDEEESDSDESENE